MPADKPKIPFESAVMPEVLGEDTEASFRCYKGISCYNACCKNADMILAPYDIIRLKRGLGLGSEEFLEKKKSAGPTVGMPPKASLQLFREMELQRKQAAEDGKYKHQPDPRDNCCSATSPNHQENTRMQTLASREYKLMLKASKFNSQISCCATLR